MKKVPWLDSECVTQPWAGKMKGTCNVFHFLPEDTCEKPELAWWFKYRPLSQTDLCLNPVLTSWVILDEFLDLSVREFVTWELGIRINGVRTRKAPRSCWPTLTAARRKHR